MLPGEKSSQGWDREHLLGPNPRWAAFYGGQWRGNLPKNTGRLPCRDWPFGASTASVTRDCPEKPFVKPLLSKMPVLLFSPSFLEICIIDSQLSILRVKEKSALVLNSHGWVQEQWKIEKCEWVTICRKSRDNRQSIFREDSSCAGLAQSWPFIGCANGHFWTVKYNCHSRRHRLSAKIISLFWGMFGGAKKSLSMQQKTDEIE